MQILTTVFHLVIVLGVLIFVHELGHFLSAKLFRMRVDRFSIGFPPRAFGKRFGDTDYCVSWIPIGGYVKIAGMIDESFDTEHVTEEIQPWEFRAKPIWQRMIVISAGVIMNILLAIGIFWGINYDQGRLLHRTTTIGYVLPGSPAARGGLKSGDSVLTINDEPAGGWEEILRSGVLLETAGIDLRMQVWRLGATADLVIPHGTAAEGALPQLGVSPVNPLILITSVVPGEPADRAGMKPGDLLVSVDDSLFLYGGKVSEVIRAHAGRGVAAQWKRGDSLLAGTLTPSAEGRIGIGFTELPSVAVTRVEYTFLEAGVQGGRDVWSAAGLFVRQIVQLVTGKASFAQSVGGPIRIAQMANQTAELGLLTYLGFIALLSISLALLNILPFPALDGGHLAFLAYEGITRKEIPAKVKIRFQWAGMILLLGFMLVVLYNDILHF
jgi:regulator of sigma E protease